MTQHAGHERSVLLAATWRRHEQSGRPFYSRTQTTCSGDPGSPAIEARPQRPTGRGLHKLRLWSGGAASKFGAVAPPRRGTRLKRTGILLVASMISCTLAVGQRHKKRPAPPEYALITGSVFNPQGALIPNATVEVRLVNGSHHWEAVTDEVGEFYVRVPPGKVDYRVRASASGYMPDQQVVHVTAAEREAIFLHLTPKKQK